MDGIPTGRHWLEAAEERETESPELAERMKKNYFTWHRHDDHVHVKGSFSYALICGVKPNEIERLEYWSRDAFETPLLQYSHHSNPRGVVRNETLKKADFRTSSRCSRRRMPERTREDAHRPHGRDDAALRSVSGSRLADARKAGMTEEELDAAIDVIAAVDAGVLNRSIRGSSRGIRRNGRRGLHPDDRTQRREQDTRYTTAYKKPVYE